MYFISGHDTANRGIEFMQGGGGGGTVGDATSVFKIDNEGIVLNEKVKDKNGTSGTTDDILVSGSGGRLSFENGLTALLGMFSNVTFDQTRYGGSITAPSSVGDVVHFGSNGTVTFGGSSSIKYFVVAFGKLDWLSGNDGEEVAFNFIGKKSGGDTLTTTGTYSYSGVANQTNTSDYVFGIAIRIE